MKKLSLSLLVCGGCLVLGGFIYDALFAGIPYQDPTPDMQARYDHHAGISVKTMQGGFVDLAVGALILVTMKVVAKKKPIKTTAANDLHTD